LTSRSGGNHHALPAAGWSERPAGTFRYRDSHLAMGPVKVAILRAGRSSKITARGAGIGFPLDEPSQQSLGVVITSGGQRYCTLFGGAIRTNQAGRFIAVRAPAPNTCPGS